MKKNRIFSYFRKADWILILVMLGLTVLTFLFALQRTETSGAEITIEVRGETYGTYSLNENRTIPIRNAEGKVMNTVEIRDGAAFMKNADCPDKLCVKEGKIRSEGQTIVCLPNRVVVTVHGGDESDYDATVR